MPLACVVFSIVELSGVPHVADAPLSNERDQLKVVDANLCSDQLVTMS